MKSATMNKARRHELKMLKYKKRLKQLRLVGKEGKFYAYRTSGKPCSCPFCTINTRNGHKPKYQDRKRIATVDAIDGFLDEGKLNQFEKDRIRFHHDYVDELREESLSL